MWRAHEHAPPGKVSSTQPHIKMWAAPGLSRASPWPRSPQNARVVAHGTSLLQAPVLLLAQRYYVPETTPKSLPAFVGPENFSSAQHLLVSCNVNKREGTIGPARTRDRLLWFIGHVRRRRKTPRQAPKAQACPSRARRCKRACLRAHRHCTHSPAGRVATLPCPALEDAALCFAVLMLCPADQQKVIRVAHETCKEYQVAVAVVVVVCTRGVWRVHAGGTAARVC